MKKLVLLSMLLPTWLSAQVGYSDFKALNFKTGRLTSLPKLEIAEVRFEDKDQNNAIDAYESCYLNFKIKNTGKGSANNIRVAVIEKNNQEGLVISNFVNTIRALDAGDEQNIKIAIQAKDYLHTGVALLHIEVSEASGFDAEPVDIRISTQSFVPPNVLVADYQFTTENGGVPKKGQVISLRMMVQNTGMGEARNVALSLNLPPNVLPISEDTFDIGTLRPSESKVVDFQFAINTRYALNTVALSAAIKESTGRYAQDKSMSINLDQTLAGISTIDIKGAPLAPAPVIALGSLRSDIDMNIPVTGLKKEHAYALIIGNEDYSTFQTGLNSEVNVLFAKQDANTFAEYAQKTLGLPKENIQLLNNATSSRMRQAIALLVKLIKAEKGNAEVYVYYAGHGFPDEQTRESYLIPVDVAGTNVTDGIKLDDLYAQLTDNPAKKVTVFLDACFSGGARNQSLLAARGVKIEPRKGTLNGNILVFSATSSDQSAMPYAEKKHGIFTYFLLKELQQSNGVIDYTTWLGNVGNQVTLNSLKINQKDQNPQIRVSEDIKDTWKLWRIK